MLPLFTFLRRHLLSGFITASGVGLVPGFAQLPDLTGLPMPELRGPSLPGALSTVGDPARFEPVFAPLRTTYAALSPDGNQLAYTVRSGEDLFVYIVAVDQPDVLKAKVLVLNDRQATPSMRRRGNERVPAAVRWMRWVTADRLVFETNRVFPFAIDGVWNSAIGEVTAIQADGSHPVVLASPQQIRRPLDVRMSAAASDFAAEDAALDASTEAEDEPAEDESGALPKPGSPASLRVLGLHPTDPTSIIVRTEGLTYKVYDINVLTGEKTLRNQEFTAPGTQALLDSWGRPRIAVLNSYRADFPRSFYYSAPGAWARPQTLDEVVGMTGFEVSPQNYFGERAVPLGFDESGDILYYAANVGRDTYGFYAFDLVQGQRLPGTMESAGADLYRAESGSFGEATSFGFSTGLTDDTAVGAAAETADAGAVAGLAALGGADAEDPDPNRHRSSSLVIDRFTHQLVGLRYEATRLTATWFNSELQDVQAWLTQNRPGRTAEIIDWDEGYHRVLVLERGPADAGGYSIIDRTKNTLIDFARRAPARDQGTIARAIPFALALPGGARVDGVLALPRDTKLSKIPLAVLCPDLPWQRRGAEYSPEFDALTRMGLAVLQINGRGTWGTGIRQRQQLKQGYEEVQIADLMLAIDQLATRYPISTKRVGLYGQGHGGFVALRALQLHPERFRGAVTVDALIDLETWLATSARDQSSYGAVLIRDLLGDEARFKSAPLKRDSSNLTRPVYTLAYRGDTDAQKTRFLANRQLYGRVRRHAPNSEFFELQHDHITRQPKAMADQWARIETFLNTVLYDYHVDVGESEVVDEP